MALAYFAFGDRCQVRKRHVKDQRLTMELVLDNVGTWKVIKLGTHQHGQLCKHQFGTHKRNIWAGRTREAITISNVPYSSPETREGFYRPEIP